MKEDEPAEEEIMTPDTLSSKLSSPIGQVWEPKVNSELNPAQDITPMAPSDVPLDQ